MKLLKKIAQEKLNFVLVLFPHFFAFYENYILELINGVFLALYTYIAFK